MKIILNTSIYLISSILKRGLPFLMTPVIVLYLNPSEFGTWSIYQALLFFIIPLIGMNMPINITRNFFNTNHQELSKLIFNLFVILFLSTSFILMIILFISLLKNDLFGISFFWLLLLPIIAFMNIANQFNLTILRNSNKAIKYGFYEFLYMLINVSVSMILIIFYSYNWTGLAYALLLSNIIIGLISILSIYRMNFIYFKFSIAKIKNILTISLPLITHGISIMVISMSGRLFLDQNYGKEIVGIYSVGATFGMIMLVIVDSFNKAWSPWMYKQLSNLNYNLKIKIVKYTYFYNLIVIILSLFISLISYLVIIYIINPSYFQAKDYVLWISIGYAFQGMYTMVFPYLVHAGKTNFLGFITFFSAIINLILNYYLINLNGPIGAAQSVLISFLILYLGVWWYSNRIFPMPWNLLNEKK